MKNWTTRRSALPLAMAEGGLARPSLLRAAGLHPIRPVRIVAPFPPGGAVDGRAMLRRGTAPFSDRCLDILDPGRE